MTTPFEAGQRLRFARDWILDHPLSGTIPAGAMGTFEDHDAREGYSNIRLDVQVPALDDWDNVLQLRDPIEGDAQDPIRTLLEPTTEPLPPYRRAFSWFAGALPDLGPDWTDESWANDECPCLVNKDMGLRVWVDNAEQEHRARPEYSRFTLESWSENGSDEDRKVLGQTDDLGQLRTIVTAAAGTAHLFDEDGNLRDDSEGRPGRS